MRFRLSFIYNFPSLWRKSMRMCVCECACMFVCVRVCETIFPWLLLNLWIFLRRSMKHPVSESFMALWIKKYVIICSDCIYLLYAENLLNNSGPWFVFAVLCTQRPCINAGTKQTAQTSTVMWFMSLCWMGFGQTTIPMFRPALPN